MAAKRPNASQKLRRNDLEHQEPNFRPSSRCVQFYSTWVIYMVQMLLQIQTAE
jgi:hypothetical protein